MLIIDRYLLRQFLWILVIFATSFIGLYVVADSVNNFEELADHAKDHGGMFRVLAEYYGYRSLSFFDEISALLILVAAMFTVSAFRRHQELTALLAAGISKARVVRPIVIAAVLLSLLAVLNRELVIPSIKDELSYNAQDLSAGKSRELRPRYDNETDILLGGAGVQMRTRVIDRPSFFLPPQLDHYGRQLIAEKAVYLSPTADRPGGYLLSGVKQPARLAEKASLYRDGRAVILSPRDADWLEDNQCFVASGVDFEQLTGGKNWRQFSSTRQLIAGLQNPSLSYGANVQVEIHSRFVRPFLDMTLLFLGLPLVLARENRNMFVAVGFCILLVVLFTIVVMVCEYLGANRALSPALAAWCPLMIFIPVAVALSGPLRE